MTEQRSRLALGAEGSTLESPAEFYESVVAIWRYARTREEHELLATASQRVAFSHCTAEEQDVIITCKQRAGLIPPQSF
jgi:hypothetical protein